MGDPGGAPPWRGLRAGRGRNQRLRKCKPEQSSPFALRRRSSGDSLRLTGALLSTKMPACGRKLLHRRRASDTHTPKPVPTRLRARAPPRRGTCGSWPRRPALLGRACPRPVCRRRASSPGLWTSMLRPTQGSHAELQTHQARRWALCVLPALSGGSSSQLPMTWQPHCSLNCTTCRAALGVSPSLLLPQPGKWHQAKYQGAPHSPHPVHQQGLWLQFLNESQSDPPPHLGPSPG